MNRFKLFILFLFILLVSGCSTKTKSPYIYYDTPQAQTTSHPTMRPYVVRGIQYYPTVVSVGEKFSGNASWYGPDFHGKLTSNGEVYDMYGMTAAHKTLPMNTVVKVVNKNNGREAIVRINDRGPFVATRIIDLSKSAANELNIIATGTALVTIEILGFATKGTQVIPSVQKLKHNPQQESVKGFALQIASFSRKAGGIQTQRKYDNIDGYHAVLKKMNTERGIMYKVWLKGFQSENEARDYKNEGHFSDAFIVVED